MRAVCLKTDLELGAPRFTLGGPLGSTDISMGLCSGGLICGLPSKNVKTFSNGNGRHDLPSEMEFGAISKLGR